jgi:hypothetical protein
MRYHGHIPETLRAGVGRGEYSFTLDIRLPGSASKMTCTYFNMSILTGI